ncbi:MAG: GTPase [Bilophila wadsworthia]
MMKETPPTLTLEATTFNKPQLQEQLSVLEQRQEAQIALAGRSNVGKSSSSTPLPAASNCQISATPGKTRSINFYRSPRRAIDLRATAMRSVRRAQELGKLIEYYLTNATLRP